MIIDIHTHTFCPAVEPLVRDLPGYAAIPYKRDMLADSAATDAAEGPRLRHRLHDGNEAAHQGVHQPIDGRPGLLRHDAP